MVLLTTAVTAVKQQQQQQQQKQQQLALPCQQQECAGVWRRCAVIVKLRHPHRLCTTCGEQKPGR
jgi:NADH pyrophosphatase NudC (nudix superfamily)